jgi:hypothetical protein
MSALWQRNPIAVLLCLVCLLVLVVLLLREGLWSLRLRIDARRIPRAPRAWEQDPETERRPSPRST